MAGCYRQNNLKSLSTFLRNWILGNYCYDYLEEKKKGLLDLKMTLILDLFTNSVYFSQLHFAFQDAKNLYMVMDYMAGK